MIFGKILHYFLVELEQNNLNNKNKNGNMENYVEDQQCLVKIF